MIHDKQSAQISQERDGRNIYAIVKTMYSWLSPQWLCGNSCTWAHDVRFTKGDDTLFDITMRSFDGAEICELVSLYILDKLSSLIGRENVGLYKDDGLAAINSGSGPVLDKMRRNTTALLKNEELSITIEINLFEMNFLDTTFNLVTGKFFPFRKPNNKPLYISAKSNHPPTIIQDLPNMIN